MTLGRMLAIDNVARYRLPQKNKEKMKGTRQRKPDRDQSTNGFAPIDDGRSKAHFTYL